MISPIKIAIADDHKIFRNGLKVSLMNKGNIQLLWEADNGTDLMLNLNEERPDVLLMDTKMPGVNGISIISLIRKRFNSTRIVVLRMLDNNEMITKILEMGAHAYLPKTSDPEEIYTAILACMKDGLYSNELLNKAVLLKLQRKKNIRQFYSKPVRFSDRELNILRQVILDKTLEEIAKEVFVSPTALTTILQKMKTKAGVKTLTGLTIYAIRNELIYV